MRIIFDFENDFTPEQIADMYSGTTGIILSKMKAFIEQRLYVLKDKIEKQQDGYIEISSRSPFNFKCYNFDDKLSRQIIESISQQDYEHSMNLIWAELHPGTIPPTN